MSGRIEVVSFDELTAGDLDGWVAIRRALPGLDSPYFHPGFAAAVHRSGHDVLVAVDRDDSGGVRSLLPVHVRAGTAVPAGWPAADFQGPVGAAVEPLRLLAALGARRYAFDHLAVAQPSFAPWVETTHASPYLDVTGGTAGYLGRASRSGRENMAQARRRARKAERELGPVRFVLDSRDPDLLDRVVALKRAQYAATGARDYFADPRHRALVHALLAARDPSFGGMLSAVHAGDTLVAAHFGLRSDRVLHWWFPVYDPAVAHLAPGWMLLRELVEAAPGAGIERIDLGRGADEYKRRAMTGATTVLAGTVTAGALARELHRLRTAAVTAAAASPLGPGLRRLVRQARRVGVRG